MLRLSPTVVSNIPRPDPEPLFGPGHYSVDCGVDCNDDDLDECDLRRLANTQPPKRKRLCVSTDFVAGRDYIEGYDDDDITPQHILSPEYRRALSEETVKHGRPLRCPDTPVRTPLRRSFRGVARPLLKGPESDGMSLDMVEIVDRLGEGDFGVVYKARYKTDGKLYALKIMKEGYVSMPPESGVTRLKFGEDTGFFDSLSNIVAHDSNIHFEHDSVRRMPSTSLLVPSEIPAQDNPASGDEKVVVKPIPFSLDEEDDGRKDDTQELEGFDDGDEKDAVQLSPRMPTLHCTVLTPKKKKQIFEAEHQSAIGGHPNIVAIKAFWEEPNGQFCILSELCGSSLSTIISKNLNGFDEKTIAGYARDLLSAIAHMHKHGVIHLDIKPANILISLDSSCLKITDFGQAYKIGSKAKPEEGDGRYMAPELLKDIYTLKADIFSLGITLYELCTPGLVVPYQGDCWEALRHDRIDFRKWRYSDPLKQLIVLMLTSDYTKRPTAEELLANDYFKETLCDSPEIPYVEEGAEEGSVVSGSGNTSPQKGDGIF